MANTGSGLIKQPSRTVKSPSKGTRPSGGVSYVCAASFGADVYVFGGRPKHIPNDPRVTAEDINEIHGLDTFRDCYVYTPGKESAEKGPFHLPRMQTYCWQLLEEYVKYPSS